MTLFPYTTLFRSELEVLCNQRSRSPNLTDQWFWKNSKDGNYSVKDGYKKLSIAEINSRQEETAMNQENTEWFNMVWNAVVPLKLNIFMWRTFRNGIPTIANLKRRMIINAEVNIDCFLCGKVLEDIHHILLDCDFSKSIWGEVSDWLKLKFISTQNFIELHKQAK